MLPVGIAVSPFSTTASSASGPRSGRLRGLSYLRHYTHGHSSNSSIGSNSGSNAASNSPPAPGTILTTTTITHTPLPHSASSPSPPIPNSRSRRTPTLQHRATSPHFNGPAANSWIPTVSGVSGLSRVLTLPAAEVSAFSSPTHSIDEEAVPDETPTMFRSTNHDDAPPSKPEPLASIRFTPFVDTRSGRQSLHFSPIERTLRQKEERIKVGRASERDAGNPSAPVGFSSKVVSRRHCEFWCDNGQWYVKDVKSSSGTFLNHIRLSAPGMESKAYPLNDGDILQLGIDFKGGEEQIFRCVKIRVELNRAWQKELNNFNMSAHRRLRNLAKGIKDPDSCSVNSSECAICLFPVAPCQSLFVAPCSHVWHYKCIRPLVEKEYPSFLCPNCRAIADLEREIEDDEFDGGMWEVPTEEQVQNDAHAQSPTGAVGPGEPTVATATVTSNDAVISPPCSPKAPPIPVPIPAVAAVAAAAAAVLPTAHEPIAQLGQPPPPLPPLPLGFSATTPPVQINGPWRRRRGGDEEDGGSSDNGSSGGETGHEGPMTPMNDAGPFMIDGGPPVNRRETLYLPLGLGTPP